MFLPVRFPEKTVFPPGIRRWNAGPVTEAEVRVSWSWKDAPAVRADPAEEGRRSAAPRVPQRP